MVLGTGIGYKIVFKKEFEPYAGSKEKSKRSLKEGFF
jgi:hypothetical protein